MVSGVVEELRTLYRHGDYEALVARAEQLLHRHRGKDDIIDRPVICAARAAALIQLGRPQDADAQLAELDALDADHPGASAVASFRQYARLYLSWASNEGVAAALEDLMHSGLDEKSVRPLEAQLLYRLGRYDEAAGVYMALLSNAKNELQQRTAKAAATTSSRLWSLTGRRSSAGPEQALSKAEMESSQQTQREIATNLMAALVLAGRPSDALEFKSDIGEFYELEYNAGCAAIAANNWPGAVNAMSAAERLFRSVVDEEEDVDRGLSPILVQRAYLDHVGGNISEAQRQYASIVRDRRADAASLAVAANNAAVAVGQLAMGKHQMLFKQRADEGHMTQKNCFEGDSASSSKASVTAGAERDRHAAVFDALKKMKATSGRDVERKLTYQQRRAMARNRAILFAQMGRLDACRLEVDRLKSEFPGDPLVPLIEASLVARTSGLELADKILQESEDAGAVVVRAARVSLAAEAGEPGRAVRLLAELFPGRAAAIATSAWILEHSGCLDDAIALLEETARNHPIMKADAKRCLAAMLLRNGSYERAAAVLNDVLLDSADDLILGQLVLATSCFDADEAERISDQLPVLVDGDPIDSEALEALPPPRKRNTGARGSPAKEGHNEPDRSSSLSFAHAERGKDSPDKRTKSKKKKKRKKILPKDYDPNGPPPDPERWLPKTLRSSYKKKKKARSNEHNFRGAQGADAAAADAAAVKNAERSAARVAETAAEGASRPSMPKGTKNKKKKARR